MRIINIIDVLITSLDLVWDVFNRKRMCIEVIAMFIMKKYTKGYLYACKCLYISNNKTKTVTQFAASVNINLFHLSNNVTQEIITKLF